MQHANQKWSTGDVYKIEKALEAKVTDLKWCQLHRQNWEKAIQFDKELNRQQIKPSVYRQRKWKSFSGPKLCKIERQEIRSHIQVF